MTCVILAAITVILLLVSVVALMRISLDAEDEAAHYQDLAQKYRMMISKLSVEVDDLKVSLDAVRRGEGLVEPPGAPAPCDGSCCTSDDAWLCVCGCHYPNGQPGGR